MQRVCNIGERRFPCSVCPIKFLTPKAARAHAKSAHHLGQAAAAGGGEEVRRQFRCQLCTTVCSTR